MRAAASAAALERRALGVGVALAVAWGASFTIQKTLYLAMGVGGFLFVRSIGMCACALLLLWTLGRPVLPALDGADRFRLLWVTALGPVGHIVLVSYGIHWSTAFSSALIMALGPVITLILLRLIGSARLGGRQWAGVALAAGGVLLLVAEKLWKAGPLAGIGDLTLLLAALAFSGYTIGVGPLIERHGGLEVMSWTTLLASPVLLALTAAAAWRTDYFALPVTDWAAYAWTVLVSAFGGWLAWNWVNRVRGVGRTAPLLYLVPPIAALIAWSMGGETFTASKLVGAGLAVGGVVWTQRARVAPERRICPAPEAAVSHPPT